ncbi:hypothetical protein GQ457_09G015800 [Hibiscus cannabinus]
MWPISPLLQSVLLQHPLLWLIILLFDRSIKNPSQTVQASSKAYGFPDVDDDIYTYGYISNPNMSYHSCYDLLHPRSSRSVIWLMNFYTRNNGISNYSPSRM